jgi:HEAT repeat protein
MTSGIRVWLGVALVAASGAAVFLTVRRPDDEHRAQAPIEADLRAGMASTVRPLAVEDELRAGTALTFSVSLQTSLAIHDNPFFDLLLKGRYRWRCLRKLDGGCVWESTFQPEEVVSSAAPPAMLDGVRSAIASPHYIEQADGLIVSMRTPPMDPTVARTLAYLAGAMQVARGSSDRFSASEGDPNGRYEAEYERSGGQLQKHKRAYTEVFGGGAESLLVTNYRHTIELAKGGYPRRISLDETLSVRGKVQAQMIDGTSSHTSIQVSLLDRSEDPGALDVALAAFTALPESHMEDQSPKPARAAIDGAAIAARSASDFISQLHKTSEDDAAGRRSRSELFNGLSALIRQDPSTVDKLITRIEAGDRDAKFLQDALANAGTEQAQQALWKRFDGFKNTADRSLMLVQMSMGPSPSEQTIARLRELKADPLFGKQASYGLGSIANRLASSGSAGSEEIVGELVDDLNGAQNTQDRLRALTALGNAGQRSSLDTLANVFGSAKDETERGAAVHALRFVQDPRADTLLARATADDDSSYVRLLAARALSFRPADPLTVRALETTLQAETSVEVRIACAKTAIAWLKQSEEARQLVAWIAQHEEVENIRRAAEDALRS